VGTGFWVIQGILLMAAIATAIYAEIERRRDDRVGHGVQDRQVPVLRPSEFTINEEARLLLLRGKIREARLGRGRLRDDVAPDTLDPYGVPPPAAGDMRQPPYTGTVTQRPRSLSRSTARVRPVRDRSPRWTTGGWLLVVGLMLFAAGVGGMWHTNVVLDAIEQAQAPFTSAPHLSFIARTLPGPIANPARYFEAVNSASATASSFQAQAILEQKQAMDRWEALLLAGLALLVISFAYPGAARAIGARRGSIAGDLVGCIGLAAVMCAALSFFELA
jgi:hypothetical protein